MTPSDDAPAQFEAFLIAFWNDVDGRAIRPLAAYVARFPKAEAAIRNEYAAFVAAGSKSARTGGAQEPAADRIAHYRILRQLGRGGQATVYLAESEKPRRQVALKVMDPGFASHAIAIERFRREADITSKLEHPGICTVYETGEAGSTLWIAMRYVDGETLASRIATARDRAEPGSTLPLHDTAELKPPPELPGGASAWTRASDGIDVTQVLAVIENVARTLHAAHEKGVIHRDIKSGNIMITREDQPVILDFGLARDERTDLPSITETGDFFGTPHYMSPEQLLAQRVRLDRRTDVWSLGVSLYECVTLRRPFEAPTRERLLQAIEAKEPPDPRSLNHNVSRDLHVVLATALEKDRDRRYQTALDFAEDLRRVRMHEPILAKPVGALVRLYRWTQRNPALATMTCGLFLALTGGLVATLVLLQARDGALSEKSAALSDYDRLGDLSRLEALQAEADKLWPCVPELVPAMKSWISRALLLKERLEGHDAALARLRSQGMNRAPERIEAASQPTSPHPSRAPLFEDPTAQFKHDTTAKLVADLKAFVDPDPHKGLLADVQARLTFAEFVERETTAKYKDAWKRAINAISASPKYHGLTISPHIGLIPIDEDPKSGLWEFVHFQTVAPGSDPIPKRGPDGRLLVTADMGIVFVLLPGGTFRMGAIREPTDEDTPPNSWNLDPEAAENEGPATEVPLDPFFMSKYEMTQGQWVRLVGRNGSEYGPGSILNGQSVDLRNPVEKVSWEDCDSWLGRLGLVLPTEAQWEYGARGGTTTPRWTGLGTAGLEKAANLADVFCQENGGDPDWKYEPWSDGYAVHAPVGSFAPNPFGLHDVLGNVWEWCRDLYGDYNVRPGPGDGLRSPPTSRTRAARGGAWAFDASDARSAVRRDYTSENRYGSLGVRPAKSVVCD